MIKELIVCVLLSMTTLTFAQTSERPTKLRIGMPEVLKPGQEGTYKKSDLERELTPENNWGRKRMKKAYWTVWSDRDNNAVYLDAEGTKRANRIMSLGEPAIIYDIKGNMARLYIDDKQGRKYPEISNKASFIGWVPMDNLILWDRCPTNDLGVQLKALIAINIPQVKEKGKIEPMKYGSPDEDNPTNLSMDMKFYFIMKEDGRKALLCQNPTIHANGINIEGWVDISNFARWYQRTCLEPNWDPDFNEHNKTKDVRAYQGKQMTSGVVFIWPFGSSNGDGDFATKYRMDPNLLRFPILDPITETDDFAHCTVFSDPRTKKVDRFYGDVADGVENVRSGARQMNLIFVVEATSGMGEYVEAIKGVLEECNKYSNRKLKVQAGAVLYGCSEIDNGSIRKIQLSDCNDDDLKTLFNAKNANGKWQGSKREVALKKAIEIAASPKEIGFKSTHSNLLIIIGNRGDEENCVLADASLLKQLKDSHIQMMSVQVVTLSSGSPAVYADQIGTLIKKNINGQYASIGETACHRPLAGNVGYSFISSNKKESVLFSQMVYPAEIGKTMSSADLVKYINNGIAKFAQSIDNWSEHFEEEYKSVRNGLNSKFIEEYLGSTLYEKVKKNNAIQAFDGYAKLRNLENDNQWRYIVYLSNDELFQLLENLEEIYDAADQGDGDRSKYREAVSSLAKNMLGQNDDSQIDKMTMNELQTLVWGLNVQTETTSKSLEQIIDTGRTRRDEYNDILEQFKSKYKELRSLYESDYRYRTLIGEDYYYWIPIEMLP